MPSPSTSRAEEHLFPESSLSYQVVIHSLSREDDLASILEVRFSGVYRPGSAGTPDARFMTSILGAALAVHDVTNTVLLDLSQLDYRWGDGLLAPLTVVDRWSFGLPISQVLLGGPSSIDALRSLLTPVGHEPPACLHATRESAMSSAAELAFRHASEIGKLP